MNNETPNENNSSPPSAPDNRPANLRENPSKRDYHTQERIEMLMEIARDKKNKDRMRALELIEEMRRDIRKSYAQRQDRAAARADGQPDPPNEQTMTEEQKGVLGF